MDKEFLTELLRTPSVSGTETAAARKVYDYMQGRADRVSVDVQRNVTAAVNPDAPFKVLMTGHIDEIGLMVSSVCDDGTLTVTGIGGIYVTSYPGHKVRIYTEKGMLYGAVVNTRAQSKKGGLEPKELRIDIGAENKADAMRYVGIGDAVIFDEDARELLNGRLSGRGLDDKLGVFIVMEALEKAKAQGAEIGIYAAATTNEETCADGAYFVSSGLKPDIGIAVDVTFATDVGGREPALAGEVCLGKGPVLCFGPTLHEKVNRMLRDAAASLGMDVQIELSDGATHTDGDRIHLSGRGVPFALVSIPMRYMHNPDEMCDLQDVQDCIDLLAAFLCACTNETDLRPF